jgi:chemotaxis protein MotA
MDLGSIVGLVLVLIGVFVGTLMKGVSPAFLLSVPAALLIVIVGAVGAAFISNPWALCKKTPALIMRAMKGYDHSGASGTINEVVSLAERARREGMLSLEEACQKIEDPFLRKGLQMAIDGTDPEQVRDVLEVEIDAMSERHKAGAGLMTQIGIFAPTFGIIGAVVGLIASMAELSDPEKLAGGISAAFVATFWGVFAANGLFLPFGNKLQRASKEEVEHKRMVVEGILAIQAGANPRVVEEMLLSFLAPSERVELKGEKRAA